VGQYKHIVTSHKEAGTLYFLLGLYSGIVGTGASFLIRLQLSKPVRILRSGQVYNTILTSHALVIIFFIVLPAFVGAFSTLFSGLLHRCCGSPPITLRSILLL